MYQEYLEEVKKLFHGKDYIVVGTDVRRVDAIEKVTGKAKYTTDFLIDNALIVRPVRSPYPHALIKNIDKAAALNLPGIVAVITNEDIPGENICGYYLDDQPFLTHEKARYIGDPVALVVAKDEEAAWAGADAVSVDYKEIPAVFEPREALGGNFDIHEKKSPADVKIQKGDADTAFKECDVVVERTYRAGSQDHAYIEPEAAIAIPEDQGGITVISTNQGPFRTRAAVARILGRPESEVRIVTPYVGGGFGGKDTYGPIISAMAAVAAAVTGQPAIIVYSRHESFNFRFKRCPFDIRYKTGATKDGKLKAIDVEYLCDCGGYAGQVIGLMRRAAYHATGVYEIPNCHVHGMAVYTNNLPPAAFNGFGNPQMLFAAETQMDLLAEELNIDPVDFRLRNALVPGSRTGTGQILDHSVGIQELIKKVADQASWDTKKSEGKASSNEIKRRGIGIGCSWHGCGTTGFKHDWAGASIIINPDGSVMYSTGIVEIGQGTITSHAMMVAETLGVPYDYIKVEPNDTSRTPDSGETHAQRGTFIGGTAAVDAALKLRKRMNTLASDLLSCGENHVVIENGEAYNMNNPLKKLPFSDLAREMYQRGISPSEFGFIKARRGYPDPENGQGDAYAAYTFGVTIAEVEVDTETGEVNVLKLYPGVAAGKIIQPEVVRGQINGCGMLGLGYAISEAVVREKGKMINDSFSSYIIPTIKDKPILDNYVVVEDEYRYSGYGAKGVGEISFIATPVAIANAVSDAIGVRFYNVPLNAEEVYFKMKGN
jgi:nicotinate dehydrogenase large molybdopterin subunit